MGELWTPEEESRLRERPYDYAYFNQDNPKGRTRKAFQIKRGMLGIEQPVMHPQSEDSDVLWNKREVTASWRDYLAPMAAMQALRERTSRSQDYAHIAIASEKPVPLAFISDYHIGSWGVKAEDIASNTDRILRLHEDYNLHIAILGDMLEMAIRLRSVAEVAGNLLPPGMQIDFAHSWVGDLSPLLLWATWDNHSVQREEELAGRSALAAICADHTIYHSGIGHTDLTIGDEVYLLATSHRFPGRGSSNPVMGQMRYMQREAPDREVVVGGDSHIPGVLQYDEAGKTRIAANCGSLQLNSTYAKRYFSLATSSAMPVVLFSPDEHIATPFFSLDHFESFAKRHLT